VRHATNDDVILSVAAAPEPTLRHRRAATEGPIAAAATPLATRTGCRRR
jgi:hypothetical protein